MKLIYISLGICLLNGLFSLQTSAQTSGEVQNETIVIEKNKELDLPPANREFEKIPEPVPASKPKVSEYEKKDVGISLPHFDTKIKVPTTKPDEAVEIHNGYVRAGFGNYTTPYLEGFIHTGKKDNYSAGARLKHLSSKNGPYKGVKNSTNEIELNGKYWTSKSWYAANVFYNRERYTFYGIKNHENADWDNDSLKNIYNDINLEASTGNFEKEKIYYTAKLGYQNVSNNHENSESNIKALLNVSYKNQEGRYIDADVNVLNSQFKDSTTFNRSLVGVSAKYRIVSDKYLLSVGLNYTYSGDTLKGSAGSHVYPLVHFDYYLIPNTTTIEVGFKGGMEANTWANLRRQNPYLSQHQTMAHTNNKMNFYATIKSKLEEKIYLKVGGAYMSYDNLWFLVNGAPDTSKFNVTYDQETISVINLNGDIAYDLQPLRLGLKADYYKYNVSDKQKQPWHRPSFVSSLYATYTIHKKIVFKTDIYYISGLRAYNFVSNTETKLKDIVDINVKAEYRFSDVFSTYFEINNLLSSKYERYMYYQSRGINFLIGLTYRF